MSQHARPAIHDSDPINFRDIQFLGFAPAPSGIPWWDDLPRGRVRCENKDGVGFGRTVREAFNYLAEAVEQR